MSYNGRSAREPVGISVVIPSLNQGRFIDEAIRSILEQDYPNVEMIVVDGGSSDDTISRLKAYGNKIRWISEKDDGQTHAIIKGFLLAEKPWLTWLNSDDLQCNKAMWKVDQAVSARPDVEVVIGEGHYIDEDGSNPRPYPTMSFGQKSDPRKEVFERGYVAQPSVFFRRDLYDRVGGLNSKRHLCMDYDLWARFAAANAKFINVDSDISGNRWYRTTKTMAQLFDLYAELVATQQTVFNAVSPYVVQAISDHLYSNLHSKFFGDHAHLFYRWIYFKALWVALNARSPLYCLKGLFFKTLSKSGPIVADRVTVRDWLEYFLRSFKERRTRSLR